MSKTNNTMKLNLKNPIVFFDLGTTGINISRDRIVELSFLKVYPNGEEEMKSVKQLQGEYDAQARKRKDKIRQEPSRWKRFWRFTAVPPTP